MKRFFWVIVCLMVVNAGLAQTQQGVVKTRGKMVNGKHVAGQGLSGATITLQGRSRVLSQGNGTFSFPVQNKTFMVQGVQKQGYQLVDADAAPKAYQYSTNTFYLVMDTPDQQAEDRLSAERKIRRTLQRQLQQREDELEEMKERLTQEEYHRRLAQLYEDQKNNEKLIADMAKEYSLIDYDQLDELNRQISDAILNGELTKADSLLRSKGDMQSRSEEIDRRRQAESKERAELAQRQANLAASETGTHKLLEDFADDCLKYHDMFKLENRHDSAAYYIELRADKDTTNAEWQFDAALYLQKQNQFSKAAIYYQKALVIRRRLAQSNPKTYELDVAMTLNNLALLYSYTQRFSESEEMYKEALSIRRCLAQSNPQAYEPYVAHTLNNLANLYSDTQRFSESEEMYKEALAIYRLAQSNPQAYEPDVAVTLNNLANLYYKAQRFSESEAMYKEALAIRRRLAQSNLQAYESDLAGTLYNIGLLKVKTEQYADAISPFEEALNIYRRLAQINPAEQHAYEGSLYWLSQLYPAVNNYLSAYNINKEWLPILKQKYEAEPDTQKEDYATTLGSQSFYAIFAKQYAEAEQYAHEGLAVDSTKHLIYANLAAALLFQGKHTEAEKIYRQYKYELKDGFLDDFRQYAEAGVIPPECEADVEKIKKLLSE